MARMPGDSLQPRTWLLSMPKKIPKKKNRGAGWQAWIDLWNDLHAMIKEYLIPGLSE